MNYIRYWEEAEALADKFLPIPPKGCLDKNGKITRDDRCLGCPMKITCELKERNDRSQQP